MKKDLKEIFHNALLLLIISFLIFSLLFNLYYIFVNAFIIILAKLWYSQLDSETNLHTIKYNSQRKESWLNFHCEIGFLS